MPNIVGLELPAAQLALQTAGVLVPASLGYFGAWPIGVSWVTNGIGYGAIAGIAIAGIAISGGTAPGAAAGTVVQQSQTSGNTVQANAPLMLSVSEYPISVAYP
jgi:hypothetical protein